MNISTLFLHDTLSIEKPLTEHCFAMKSGSNLPFCNRVYAPSLFKTQEVKEVDSHFEGLPFRWFVNKDDKAHIKILEQNQFVFACSFPAMSLNLNDLLPDSYPHIIVREINNTYDSEYWLEIVGQVYNSQVSEFATFIAYLQKNSLPGALRLYCGYYDNIPVATAVTVQYDTSVALHWIGTLPLYRNRGIGYAITHTALMEAKKNNAIYAVLMASEMGKPLYAKIGFKDFATYNVYKKEI